MSDRKNPLDELREKTNKVIEKLTERLEDSSQKETGPTQSHISQKEVVARQKAILERVMDSAAFLGHVVAINGDQKEANSTITISCYGQLLEAKSVPGLELKLGDLVRLAPNSSQIIGRAGDLDVGSICFVRRIVDENFSEVDFSGSTRRVFNGSLAGKVESEDRVILDSSGSIIVARLDKAATRFRLGSKPTVKWDDICGQENAKRQLKEMVEMPFKCPGLYKHYGLTQPKGALIFGPPGCGKTMLLEAVATAISEIHGSSAAIDSGFISIKGPEVLDMYVGIAEKAIRQLFVMAKKHKDKYGFPAVIAIDEAEALLSKRGSGKSSDMEKTIVPTFLAEMQGIDDSSAIVFLCTNRPDVLDPAVIRDGRIDRQIKVSRPNRQSVQEIFTLNLKKFPIAGSIEELSLHATDEFYSETYSIYEVSRSDGKQVRFKLADLVNGAMVVGIVQKAVWAAFERDLASGGEKDPSKRTKVSKEDVKKAVEETYHQKFDLPHGDELGEFVADFRDEVSGIKKLRLSQT